MGILRQLWMKVIAEQFFAANPHLAHCLNWNEAVVEGVKTANIPQAGAAPDVVVNDFSLEFAIADRVDTLESFDINNYKLLPQRVSTLEALQANYAKMQSMIRVGNAKMFDRMSVDVMYSWRPQGAAKIIETTGAARPTKIVGASGNRKKTVMVDLFELQERMSSEDVPDDGMRKIMMTPRMIADLQQDPDIKGTQVALQIADYQSGKINKIAGFEVFQRSKVMRYSDTGLPKIASSAVSANDCDTAIAWHPSCVGHGMGAIQVYYNAEMARNYGDLMSMEANCGGGFFFADHRGAYGLKEANI